MEVLGENLDHPRNESRRDFAVRQAQGAEASVSPPATARPGPAHLPPATLSSLISEIVILRLPPWAGLWINGLMF